jgi:hypothetical protein
MSNSNLSNISLQSVFVYWNIDVIVKKFAHRKAKMAMG